MVKTRSRRVRFAPGPLADQYDTHDGHPQHEGQTAVQRRSIPSPWPLDLTPHSIKMLEAEVGDICQASIMRLKRRVGLLPPIQRPLEYLTASHSSSQAQQTQYLQPIFSRARSSQQANKQTRTAKKTAISNTVSTVEHSSTAHASVPSVLRPLEDSHQSLVCNGQDLVSSQHQSSSGYLNQESVSKPASALLFSDDSKLRTSVSQQGKMAGNKSPKRNLGVKTLSREQSIRSKAVRKDVKSTVIKA